MSSPLPAHPSDVQSSPPTDSPQYSPNSSLSNISGKRDRSEEETPLSSELLSRKPGRKPVATAPISKRQMQNREAQRLFRERKIRQQQHLYDRIQELEDIRDTTQRENYHLKLVAQELQVQNERLQATLKNVCTENNSSNCAPFPVDGDKPNSSDFQASFQTQGPWRYTNIKPLIHKPSTAVQDPTPRPVIAVHSTAPQIPKEEFRHLAFVTSPSAIPKVHSAKKQPGQEQSNTLKNTSVKLKDPHAGRAPSLRITPQEFTSLNTHGRGININQDKHYSPPLLPRKCQSSSYTEDISIATKHTHRTIEYAASRTNEPGLCERARSKSSSNLETNHHGVPNGRAAFTSCLNKSSKAREEREAIESTEYRASRDSVYPIQPNDRPPPGPSTRSAAHTTEGVPEGYLVPPEQPQIAGKSDTSTLNVAQFRNAVEAGANDGIYSLVDQIAHSTANEDPSMAQQSNINYQYNALSVTPNTDQHSNMNLPTLTPDSLEALSADDGVSVAYLDQLVMELHDLCQEMKKKAALSSEPFEFEWPCEEIDQKLQKMKEFKP